MNPFEVVVVVFVMLMVVAELALIYFAVKATIQQYLEERADEEADLEAQKHHEDAS